MNAMKDTCEIELRGLEMIKPIAKLWSKDGDFVANNRGGHWSIEMQQAGFDFACTSQKTGGIILCELKTEREWTGNLFYENWSNLKFGMQTVGWGIKIYPDFLWCLFLDTSTLVVIRYEDMFNWWHGDGTGTGQYLNRRYLERPQRAHQQLNRTIGRLIPVSDLCRRLPDAVRVFEIGSGVPILLAVDALPLRVAKAEEPRA